jgi:Snf7
VALEQLVRTPAIAICLPIPTSPRLLTCGFAQVSTIEFSLVEVSVLHGLKQGNEVLKEIHKELNVESVEKLLEETAEAREYQRVCLFSPIAFSFLTDLGLYRRKSIICLRIAFPWTMKRRFKES